MFDVGASAAGGGGGVTGGAESHDEEDPDDHVASLTSVLSPCGPPIRFNAIRAAGHLAPGRYRPTNLLLTDLFLRLLSNVEKKKRKTGPAVWTRPIGRLPGASIVLITNQRRARTPFNTRDSVRQKTHKNNEEH